jgi:hypothetical protein
MIDLLELNFGDVYENIIVRGQHGHRNERCALLVLTRHFALLKTSIKEKQSVYTAN